MEKAKGTHSNGNLQKQKSSKTEEECERGHVKNLIPYSIPKTGLLFSEKGKCISIISY